MNAVASLKPVSDWTKGEGEALRKLSLAVYPPKESAAWPGRHLQWAAPEWGVRVVGSDGALVSYAGIVLRMANHDGRPVRIGGVGGVMTHPGARRRGNAAMGLRQAAEFFHEQPDVEFSVLVCKPSLIGYYSRLGWKEFGGRLLTTQNGATVDFTFNRVMVLDVRSSSPLTGTLDLLGPPW